MAWVSASVIVYLNIHLVIDEISGWVSSAGANKILIYTIVVPLAIASLALLVYIFIHPFFASKRKKRTQLPHGQAIDFSEIEAVAYTHIGIAIDFSGNDQIIIRSALNQGGKSARYTIIHVVESAVARYYGKNTMDYETSLDSESLAKYKAKLKELGYHAVAILGYKLSKNIDLLVMGVHGHKGFKDLIFGTTVDSVRHKIKIPILVVN